jgi:hypothetical protein
MAPCYPTAVCDSPQISPQFSPYSPLAIFLENFLLTPGGMAMTTRLRQRMIEDMQLRGLAGRTQEAYVATFRQLAEHYGKSLYQQVSSSGRHQRRFSA